MILWIQYNGLGNKKHNTRQDAKHFLPRELETFISFFVPREMYRDGENSTFSNFMYVQYKVEYSLHMAYLLNELVSFFPINIKGNA